MARINPVWILNSSLALHSPVEACRAIRKKLKYGDVHRQLRALTLLKALVEICGPKFQCTSIRDPGHNLIMEHVID